MFGAGRNLIASLTYKEKDYALCVNYDADFNQFNAIFVEGDWQLPQPNILWYTGWERIPSQLVTPEDLVNNILNGISGLNRFLVSHFNEGTSELWGDRLAAYFRKVVFYLDGAGIPQVKILT